MTDLINTVAVTDFKMKSPTLAKVIISFTGKQTKDELRASLQAKFDNLATPVEDSFRVVKPGVAVGFVRANKEVRVVDDKELRASYRVMSSNIMMDNSDKSLWEVKTGKAGKFLARHGQEDLSELVSASLNRRTDIPGLRHIAVAKAASGELVSFVSKTGDMDHGFVVAANDEKIKLVSYNSQSATVIDYDAVTAISPVPVQKEFVSQMTTAGISRSDKDQAIEYWKQFYKYAPSYLEKVIDQVNSDTVA